MDPETPTDKLAKIRIQWHLATVIYRCETIV